MMDHKPSDTFEFFSYAHLPPKLQPWSQMFHEVAEKVAALPASHEQQKALDALLIAKDAAVRAFLKSTR